MYYKLHRFLACSYRGQHYHCTHTLERPGEEKGESRRYTNTHLARRQRTERSDISCTSTVRQQHWESESLAFTVSDVTVCGKERPNDPWTGSSTLPHRLTHELCYLPSLFSVLCLSGRCGRLPHLLMTLTSTSISLHLLRFLIFISISFFFLFPHTGDEKQPSRPLSRLAVDVCCTHFLQVQFAFCPLLGSSGKRGPVFCSCVCCQEAAAISFH